MSEQEKARLADLKLTAERTCQLEGCAHKFDHTAKCQAAWREWGDARAKAERAA